MLLLFLLLNCLCLISAFAWENFPKRCENYSIAMQENFNVTQFLGTWYEAEEETKCTIVNLTRVNEFEIKIEHWEYGGNVTSSMNGTISIREPSYLNWMNTSVIVVGTDYKDYAVLWLCKNSNESESQSQQQLWIWGRNYSLPQTTAAAINATVASNNLTHLPIEGKLEGCRFIIQGGGNGTTTVTNGTVVTPPSNATPNGTIHNHTASHNDTSHNGARGITTSYVNAAMIVIVMMLFPAACSKT